MRHRDPVRFAFALMGPPGMLDQMMTLDYRGRTTAAPVIRYQALDRQGRPLPEVSVHSCYGSDRGELALTPGENTDLLYLRGPDAGLTADVQGEVLDLRPLERRENPITQAVQQDAQGRELPSGGGFDQVSVVNPWPAEALSRVVAVALDAPEAGPQGAVDLVALTPTPIVVPASSQVSVAVPADAYAAISRYFGSAFVTVKAYPAVA